jgi:predicted Zn finger-like uncharacterized protein
MFTQCPDCRTTYSVSKKQLRGKKPQLFCGHCNKKFNAKTLLNHQATELLTEVKAEFIPKSESGPQSSPNPKSAFQRNPVKDAPNTTLGLLVRAVDEPEDHNELEQSVPDRLNPQKERKIRLVKLTSIVNKPVSYIETAKQEPAEVGTGRLPWEKEQQPLNTNWLLGLIVGVLLLFGQLAYFESDKLSQNPAYRPQLEKLCHWLSCNLADYQNLDEFEVLQGSFTQNADRTITFKAVINNQASFKQKLPNIKLTLLDYNEQLFAQRIFYPKEHLSAASNPDPIAPDATVSINLTIAAPKTPIGGYTFDLIY